MAEHAQPATIAKVQQHIKTYIYLVEESFGPSPCCTRSTVGNALDFAPLCMVEWAIDCLTMITDVHALNFDNARCVH